MRYTKSATNHVPRDDIEHAFDDDDANHRLLRRGDPPVHVTVGRDRGGRWLEILWSPHDDDDVTFHAMAITKQFRHLIPKGHR